MNEGLINHMFNTIIKTQLIKDISSQMFDLLKGLDSKEDKIKALEKTIRKVKGYHDDE
jgi:hypothetical protein